MEFAFLASRRNLMASFSCCLYSAAYFSARLKMTSFLALAAAAAFLDAAS